MFLMLTWVGLRCVIVAFPGHTHQFSNMFCLVLDKALQDHILFNLCPLSSISVGQAMSDSMR